MKHYTSLGRIVFFGTPEFAVPTLEALVKGGFNVVAVVTQTDKPVGRGLKMEAPAVKVKAQELGLKVWQPETLKSGVQPKGWPTTLSRGLQLLKPDLGIAVAYGKIIPKQIIDLFPRGILNIHPSLLPKYRGPSPIQATILSGDTETGVTIMLLDEEVDHGAIVASSVQRLGSRATGGELSVVLAQLGAKLLIKTLPQWLNAKITSQPQEHTKATYTKLLTREDGRIDWHKSAEYIERMVRAYDPWPGTWTRYKDTRLKILRVSLLHSTIGCASNATPGFVWKTDDERLAINCNPGSLTFDLVQSENKKPIGGQDFLHGHHTFLSTKLI